MKKFNSSSDVNSFKQLRLNFLTLVKRYHPDLHPDIPNISEKFTNLINEYKKCLSLFSNKKIYNINVYISLQDAIMGCERFFLSNDGKRKFLLKIPAGVKNKDNIYYKDVQINENCFSILNAIININFPKNYVYKNNKLILKIYVFPWKMYFGGKTVIIGPDGCLLHINIPKKTKSGAIFAIDNEGLYNKKNNQRDKLYIQVISKLFIDLILN
jgi:DnaJ-class molecular chaperone